MNKALRTLLVALAVLALSALGAVAAFAGAPTFTKVSAKITSSTTTTTSAATSAADALLATTDVLLVSFQENRVGQNTGITYTVTANASVTYACINGGSKNPKSSNKMTVEGPVSGGGTLTSDSNGNVKGAIEVSPPGPGDFTCPTGQQLVLVKLTFTNIKLTDTTNGIDAGPIPDQTKIYFNV